MALKRRESHSLGVLVAATAAPELASAQTAGSAWDQQAEPWYAKDLPAGIWTGAGALPGERIASDMGFAASFFETTFGNAPAALQAGQFDIMFVLDRTPASPSISRSRTRR